MDEISWNSSHISRGRTRCDAPARKSLRTVRGQSALSSWKEASDPYAPHAHSGRRSAGNPGASADADSGHAQQAVADADEGFQA